MKNNEFFNNMYNTVKNNEATHGEHEAFWAWRDGIDAGLDCPFFKNTMWDEHVSDFLTAIEEKAAAFSRL